MESGNRDSAVAETNRNREKYEVTVTLVGSLGRVKGMKGTM